MNKFFVKDGVVIKAISGNYPNEAEPKEYDQVIESDILISIPVKFEGGKIIAIELQENAEKILPINRS